MKRVILAFVVFVLSLTVSAQDQTTWIHQGLYHLSQCFGIIELSDGSLAVREAVFDDNLEDVGFNIFKISSQGELLDSLFIESHDIDGYRPILRDPQNDNSNIMISFYKDGEMNFYKATYFNDNLEITNEITTDYYDNCNVPTRFFIDSNNDIICRSKIDDNSFCLVRMGLDGELKLQSSRIEKTSQFLYENPIFEISAEPLRYGYMRAFDNSIVFDVYDEYFNCVFTKTITKIGEWTCTHKYPYDNACYISDGSFVVTLEGTRLDGTQGKFQLMAVKFNSDIEIESACKIGEEYLGGSNLPKYQYLNRNLCVTDNNIYLVWQKKEERWEKLSLQTMFVTCLDMNMNLVWEEPSLSVLDNGMIANYGLIPLSNGGVALSGWLSDEMSWYESKKIYAVMFDNHLATPAIETTDGNVMCYPNPTTGVINVSGENLANIEVVNIMGQTMLKTECNGGDVHVDISSLTPGIYLIKARMSDGTEVSERVVKE